MAASVAVTLDMHPNLMDSIPRLRWSPVNNRFHYNMPIAAEPGERGFVLLQEFDHTDNFTSWALPPNERHHLEEMERVNNLIHDVENAVHLRETLKVMEKNRKHDEEFHERVKTDEEAKAKAMKKKTRQRSDSLPKRSFESTRQKPTRIGRVHQPR